MGFPPWIMRSLVLISIVGFPISFVLAWVIDIRAEGLVFDLPLWIGDSESPRPQKKSDLVYAVILAVLLGGATYVLVVRFLDYAVPAATTMVEAEAQPEVPANSIAVLAFENISSESEVDYFAAGLAEEILYLLGKISELKVAARTSSFQFRDQSIDIRTVAELLQVRHVLEGSARQSGERIRVAARLTDGSSGYEDWSDVYERPLDDIFDIQQEIAAAVVNELKIVMSVESETELRAKPTENTDAYVFYLEGSGRLRSSRDEDVMRIAITLFEKALDIDPRFARAYAGICEAELRLFEASRSSGDFEAAQDACQKATELDPGLNIEIHLALGNLFRYRGWYDQAEEQLNRALALDPVAVDAYIQFGQIRQEQDRRGEAEEYYLQAVELKRNYWRAHEALGSFYYRTERYEEAVREFGIATELAPDAASAFGGLGAAYSMLGDVEKANIATEESLRLKPSRQGFTNLGIRHYYAGRFADAAEMQLKAIELAPDDHRLWGRLAESYRFVPGKEAESRAAYARAAELAEASLKINSEDWKSIGLLGLYYAYLGQPDKALELVDNSIETSNRNSEAFYFKALERLVANDPEAAIAALEDSLEMDPRYSRFLETDPDLQQLRDDQRFQELLRKSR
ncbi:MAG: tetratricopeptide repeat protein [Gammaproteobacteria bacterium]